jgi:hypothetical protein
MTDTTCVTCGGEIHPLRIEALGFTDHCMACERANPEPKVLGVPCFGHKTGASVGVISPRATGALRLVSNQYHRVRYRG